jgi:hypothetical protein
MRSTPEGVSGWTELTRGGAPCMIAAITEAGVLPANAFCAVSIS